MSIPIISPIELSIPVDQAKRLPSPDTSGIEDAEYTVHEEEPVTPPPTPYTAFLVATPALIALNEMEQAAEVNQYYGFGWWRERINTIRDALKQSEAENRLR